ncbi:transposase (plasmid) [Polymorphobacter sp. PAMC 29334]|nr:transposase [Polymorphobacter sp. PAMC 29334]
MIDIQSIKAPAAQNRGFDVGKNVLGRKRHFAVDTDRRLHMVNLTTADISDSAGAQAIVAAIRKHWPWLKQLFADVAYNNTILMNAATYRDFVLEITRRSDKEVDFKVPARQWVVERTLGWMTL